MAYQPKILAFAGSLRKDSYNKKLVKVAAKGAEDAGAIVTYIDLKDYPLPIYDQEIEDSEGLPENAIKLKALMQAHDGFLVACPEYNSSMPAVFKNVIDWTSRISAPNEKNLSCYTDKVVALLSASPGGFGGMRGLVHVRSMFGSINSIVLPQQKCIPNASSAFDDAGNFKDAKVQSDVQAIGRTLADFLKKHKS